MSIVQSLQKAGRYQLVERLGFNGVAATYKGFQPDTQQQVVVVAIAQSDIQNPVAWERFQTEFTPLVVAPASRLAQPVECGADGGVAWAAYEFLQGKHLGQEVRETGLPHAARCLEIATQAVEALAALQQAGQAHRMITPASIFLTSQGHVKLLHAAWGRMVLGVTGGPGNPGFMSNLPFLAPEVALGAEGDEASDVYSLGANLYFLLSGQPTYWADEPMALLRQINDREPDCQVLRQFVPEEVCQVIEEMLARDPEERPLNLEALHSRLHALAEWLYTAINAQDQQGEASPQYAGDQIAAMETHQEASPAANYSPEQAAIIATLTPEQQQWLFAMTPEQQVSWLQQQADYQRQLAEYEAAKAAAEAQAAAAPTHQGSTLGGGRIAPPPSQQAMPDPPRQEVSSGGASKGAVMALVFGGLFALLIVIGAVVFLIMSMKKSETAAAPSKEEIRAEAQKAEAKKARNYQISFERLRRLGALNKENLQKNGTWAFKAEELKQVGAKPEELLDGWGNKFEVRENTWVVTPGADGKWNTADDFGIDCETMDIGSESAEVMKMLEAPAPAPN